MSMNASKAELSSDSSLFIHLLRSIAAQAVLVGHALSLFKVSPFGIRHMQNIGVLVFFILSGVLITYSTIQKKNRSDKYGIKSYFMDRFVRIYSGFLPAILLVVILDMIIRHLYGDSIYIYTAYSLRTFIGNIFMLQDFPFNHLFNLHTNFSFNSYGSGRPFWTIAVEWWLYLFFGILVFWKSIKLPVIVKIVVFTIFSIVPFYNLIAGTGNGLTLMWFFGAVVCMLLMYGIGRPMGKTYCFLASFALLATALIRYSMINTEYDVLFAGILSASLLFIIFGLQQTNIIRAPWLKKTILFIADYSFSLYLLHYTILHFFMGQIGKYDISLLVVGSIIAANVVSMVFAMGTEMKHKQLRKWIAGKYGI